MKLNRPLIAKAISLACLLGLFLAACNSQNSGGNIAVGSPAKEDSQNGTAKDEENQRPEQVVTRKDVENFLQSTWTPESLAMIRASKLFKGKSEKTIDGKLFFFTLIATQGDDSCNSLALVKIEPNDEAKNDEPVKSEFWNISYCGKIKRVEMSLDENVLQSSPLK